MLIRAAIRSAAHLRCPPAISDLVRPLLRAYSASGRRLQTSMATRTGVGITAPPLAGQLIEHEGKTYETVREGHAYILIPPNTQKSVDPQAKAKAGEHLQICEKLGSSPVLTLLR